MAGKSVGMRGVLSLNTRPFEQSLGKAGYQMQGFSRQSVDGMQRLNAAVLAGATAWATYAAAGVRALSELQGEIAQVSFLYSGITTQQTRLLEQQARYISGQAGVSAPAVAQGAFRLASGGTALQDIPAELAPIAAFAGAVRADVGGTALSARQIAGLGRTATSTGLDLLSGAAQVSTTDVAGIRSLAPRVIPAGNVLGLSSGESLGLLAAATQVAGTPEEGATGVTALLAESVKSDSKFAKRFEETFGESFTEATKGKGYEALLAAWRRAFDTWGETEFFSSLGRRAGIVGSALVADPATAARIGDVAGGSAGLSAWITRQWQDGVGELVHTMNQVRESNDELQYRIGEGARDGVIGALKELKDTLDNNQLGQTMQNLGNSFGRFSLGFARILGDLTGAGAVAGTALTQDLIPGGNQFSLFDLGATAFLGANAINLGRGRYGEGMMGRGLRRVAGAGPRLPSSVGLTPGGLSVIGGGMTLASLGLRGAGWIGAGVLANELITQTTGFNPWNRFTGDLRNITGITPSRTGFGGPRQVTRTDEWLRAALLESSYQVNAAGNVTPEQLAILNQQRSAFIPREIIEAQPDPRRPGRTFGETLDASLTTGLQALTVGANLDPGTGGFGTFISQFARQAPEAFAVSLAAGGFSAEQVERTVFGTQFERALQPVVDHLERIEEAAEETAENTSPETQVDRAIYYSPIDVDRSAETLKLGV